MGQFGAAGQARVLRHTPWREVGYAERIAAEAKAGGFTAGELSGDLRLASGTAAGRALVTSGQEFTLLRGNDGRVVPFDADSMRGAGGDGNGGEDPGAAGSGKKKKKKGGKKASAGKKKGAKGGGKKVGKKGKKKKKK